MSPSVSIRLLLAQSDARLVELARAGHERAFEALVLRYRRPLLGYCRRLLLREERAEEAMQQGLLQAWLALREGTEVREVKPWLYRIVHNSALNMLRVSGYDYASLSDTLRGAEAPQDDLDRRITIREAFAGLAALPEMQREALLRTAVEGRSHEEVARALGLSEGALRGLVYRARVSLRAAATALTPPPIVNWAISHRAAMSAPLTTRVAELATSGGSVGVSGFLLKSSAVVVSAGALAGSISAGHHHQHPRPRARLLIAQQTAGSPMPPATADAAASSLPAPPSSAGSRARFNAATVRRHGPASPSARALLGVHGLPEAGLPPAAGGDSGLAARPDSRVQQPDGQHREGQPTPAGGDIHESSHQGDTKTGTGGEGSVSVSNDGPSASGSPDQSGSSSSGTGSSTGSSDSGSGTSSTNDSSSPSGSSDKLSFSGESDGGLVNEPSGDGGSSADGSNSTGSGSSSPDGGLSSLSN
jgi:RNA polymerase sigma factor (sigma-70 family)